MPDSLFGDSDTDQDDLDLPVISTTSNSTLDSTSNYSNLNSENGSSEGLTAVERSEGSSQAVSTLTWTPLEYGLMIAQQVYSPPHIATSGHPPPIPGLHLFPNAIPTSLQHSLTLSLSSTIFPGSSNQVMLFDSPSHSSLPSFLTPLLDLLPSILEPLPEDVRSMVFDEERPRQCILNLYREGEGISPHVDLPDRYADGIVGISLLSSTVMDFVPVVNEAEEAELAERRNHSVRLRPGSVYVLSGEARYRYTHGIAYRKEDAVMDEEGNEMIVRRSTRMSITLRRMKEGAEIIGPR